jgi:hypothetical protein
MSNKFEHRKIHELAASCLGISLPRSFAKGLKLEKGGFVKGEEQGDAIITRKAGVDWQQSKKISHDNRRKMRLA